MFCFEYGKGNVYAQLGFADAEEMPLKANIVKTSPIASELAG